MNEWMECWRKYAVFSGRARRKEYWMFALVNCIISVVLGFTGVQPLIYGYSLAALLPSLSVGVRRFHDLGRSGKDFACYVVPIYVCIILIPLLEWATMPKVGLIARDGAASIIILLVIFLPLILGIRLICILAKRGEPQANQYGEPPVV